METEVSGFSWLNNSSFPEELVVDTANSQNVSEGTTSKSIAKDFREYDNSQISLRNYSSVSNQSGSYSIDKTPCKEYLSVPKIYKPQCPIYSRKYRNQIRKRIKYKRYFKINTRKSVTETENENLTFKEENDFMEKRKIHNMKLNENPNNIQYWLDYLEFEDTVYENEKMNKKGSIARAQRVLADRKISIIEKALTDNPDSVCLYRKLLDVARAYPADECEEMLEKMLKNRKDNIILWQGLIENYQCSIKKEQQIFSKYIECLSELHKIRIKATYEKDICEQNILRMLYQCGLYVRQAGLFEKLWFHLKHYLDLTFSLNADFQIESHNECLLTGLEKSVLETNMPKHEQWFRIEKLREACHWLPYVDDDCVDPQRMVFSEDVDSLLHPIAIPENIFKLVVYVLTLLKVPLIPCRHTTMQDLGMDYVSSSLDTIESLLPLYWDLYPIKSSSHDILKDMSRFTAGPQYLRPSPGQIEYLNFVLSVMESCANNLQGKYQISVRIWWCRFQRLLVVLKKRGMCGTDRVSLSAIKKLLKANPDNELYYIEYALMKKELNNNMNECSAILNTILEKNTNKGIITNNWSDSQANQCYLIKVLIETTMAEEQFPLAHNTKDIVFKYLARLALQKPVNTIQPELLEDMYVNFNQISDALLRGTIRTLIPADHFLPDFTTDFIICHAWFLYLYRGIFECGHFLDKVIQELKNKSDDLNYQIEVLYEMYSTVLFLHVDESSTCGSLQSDVLLKGLQEYPNNLHLLSLIANEQIKKRSTKLKWWNVQKILIKSERPLAVIVCVLLLDKVQSLIIAESRDTITGEALLANTQNNQLMNLFKKITDPNTSTRRCGLIWRLFLNKASSKQDIFNKAMEACPWIKALHMDAVIYMPNNLSLVQDLIIEKGLRIHVTPEEMENL